MDEIKLIIDALKALIAGGTLKPSDTETLINLQSKLYELMFENKDLKDEVRTLNEKMKALEDLERIEAEYYVKESNGSQTGPICPKCYQTDHIVTLLQRTQTGGVYYYDYCPSCRTKFKLK